jgi:hypothetical protein
MIEFYYIPQKLFLQTFIFMIQTIISIIATILLFKEFRKLPVVRFAMLAGLTMMVTSYFELMGYDVAFFHISNVFFILDLVVVNLGVLNIISKTNLKAKNISFILNHSFNYCLPVFLLNEERKNKQEQIIQQILTEKYQIVK